MQTEPTYPRPLNYLIMISLSCFLAQVFISYPLWYNQATRTFPFVPMVGFGLDVFLTQLNPLLFGGLVLGTVGTAFLKHKIPAILLSGISLVLLCLQDVTRLQPWVYQHLIVLGILYAHYKVVEKMSADDNRTWAYFQLLYVAVYFWAGFNKINVHYTSSVFEWFMGITELTKPFSDNLYAAYGSALIELGAGLGLLFRPTRKLAVGVILGMHIFILYMLMKDNWNKVVYPWNVEMMLGVLILFWRDTLPMQWASIRQAMGLKVLTGLLFIMPTLNLFGLWQYNFSFSMYSGLSLELELVAKDAASECFPDFLHEHKEFGFESDSTFYLSLDDWTMHEFQVPIYAEAWTASVLKKEICKCIKKHEGYIRLEYSPRWDTIKPTIKVACQ